MNELIEKENPVMYLCITCIVHTEEIGIAWGKEWACDMRGGGGGEKGAEIGTSELETFIPCATSLGARLLEMAL